MSSVEPPAPSAVPEAFRQGDRQRRWMVLAGLALLLVGFGACVSVLVTQPMLTARAAEPAVAVAPERLEADVRLLSEGCAPRDWRSGGLTRAAEAIASAFQAAGGRVSRQSFEIRGHAVANVIASFGPESGPRIVVGAHYDACGDQPGADDNASGVACLLELGRICGRAAPARRVDLVAYTLEEPPFFRTSDMGSARHARLMREAGTDVRAVLVLEMVGRYTDTTGSQRYPSPILNLLYPSRGNFLLVAGRLADIGLTREVKAALRGAAPLPVVSINGPRWIPGMDFSDHYPYWDQGFPAVMLTDTAFYRNKDYHTEGDTADRLDYRRMAQVVQGVHAAVTRLAMRAP